jgi:hypothetical protein
MTVFDLIQEIRCRDMRIEVVDGQIQLGPKSAITPDLRQAVIQNKHQISMPGCTMSMGLACI